MKAVLICPSSRPEVKELGQATPLAAIPFLGETLVEYWLTSLALSGAKEVRILADDRPDHIRAIVGRGERWGLRAEVVTESRELTPAQAQIKHTDFFPMEEPATPVFVLDHFPGTPRLLFASYAKLYTALMRWLPYALTADRVGVHQIRPGVWVDRHACISSGVKITGPCWIGSRAYIGTGAVLGPGTIVEDRAFVEGGAEIVRSVVGQDTFVGRPAALQNSLAWGGTLVNWQTGSHMEISDAFLLCGLRRPPIASSPRTLLGRFVNYLFPEPTPHPMPLEVTLTNKERLT